MKQLILILAIVFLGATSFAQRTITDTLQGNETVNFSTMQGMKVATATCTQLGGTSDGTLALYGSVDGTNWSFLNFSDLNFAVASPDASITGGDLNQLTITNGLVASWVLLGGNQDTYPYYRITGVGTASDTTLVTIKWSK